MMEFDECVSYIEGLLCKSPKVYKGITINKSGELSCNGWTIQPYYYGDKASIRYELRKFIAFNEIPAKNIDYYALVGSNYAGVPLGDVYDYFSMRCEEDGLKITKFHPSYGYDYKRFGVRFDGSYYKLWQSDNDRITIHYNNMPLITLKVASPESLYNYLYPMGYFRERKLKLLLDDE
jgi:hypothetical protein